MQHSNLTGEGVKAKNKKSLIDEVPSGAGVPGYDYGSPTLAKSPVSLREFELLKQTVLWTTDDAKYMRMSIDVLKDQTDDILDVWMSLINVYPHLSVYFSNIKDQKVNADYMNAVRLRFKQWIVDTAKAEYDQKWLDYQHEIALRHHMTKKNKTDQVEAAPFVHYRYIPAFVYPMTATLKPFLSKKHEHSGEDVECMHQAWVKSVLLQVCLWSHVYIKEGEY